MMSNLLFSPIKIKGVEFRNRIMMSPMCMYCAEDDGLATDWHFVHYGSHAMGGAGLIMLESVAVESKGRISHHDLGIWNDEQIFNLKRIVDFVHQSEAKIGIQLAHAGRKARVQGKIVAPSSIPYNVDRKKPDTLTKDDIREVVNHYIHAAERVNKAGFDVIEIHAAHGYLIHEFLSPLTNMRQDEFGGTLEKRFRILGEIIDGIKSVWPKSKPLFMRVSATDYAEGGIDRDMIVEISKLAKDKGVDMIDVSSGGLVPNEKNRNSYPGHLVEYSCDIRELAGIATIAVGKLTSKDLIEELLQNKRADMVALGRELLRNPNWPLNTAKEMNETYFGPIQYKRAYNYNF